MNKKLNHDHLKNRMVPLPDPEIHGDRPGYDKHQMLLKSTVVPLDRLQIVEVIEPQQRKTIIDRLLRALGVR